jgi:hypothetical protein
MCLAAWEQARQGDSLLTSTLGNQGMITHALMIMHAVADDYSHVNNTQQEIECSGLLGPSTIATGTDSS